LQLNEYDVALELCTLGLARQPESPELAWLAGFTCYEMGRIAQAVTWSQMAIALGNFEGIHSGDKRIGFRHLPGWFEGPYDVLRYAYRRLGQHDLAHEAGTKFTEARRLRTNSWPRQVELNRDESSVVDSSTAPASLGHDANGQWIVTAMPKRARRVAVLGLYSSGSTATATILDRLGVKLGRRYFENYYEPLWLSAQLRQWWQEPHLIESVSKADRVRVLREWLNTLEHEGHQVIGAKHPLLTMCGADILDAWGPDTHFIWSWRPLDKSIESLQRRNWWPGIEGSLQTCLWDAAELFFEHQPHLRVEFDCLLENPQATVDQIVAFLDLNPREKQREEAIAAIWRRTDENRCERREFVSSS
jgi:hypothetical protein